MDSIWNNPDSKLSLKAQNWYIHGHVYFSEVIVINLSNKFAAFPTSYFKISNYMYVHAKDFDNGGILKITNNLEMEISNFAIFHKNSTTNTSYFKMQVEKLAKNEESSTVKCKNGDLIIKEKFINNGIFEATENLKVASKHLINTGKIFVCETLVLNPIFVNSAEWNGTIENASKIICKNGKLLTKCFNNAGHIDVHESMEITTESMNQKKSAKIIVGDKLELKACYAKNGEWNGEIKAKDFILLAIGDLIFW